MSASVLNEWTWNDLTDLTDVLVFTFSGAISLKLPSKWQMEAN